MKTKKAPLDPRLTKFNWDKRKMAPVARLLDPHVHCPDKPQDFKSLATVLDDYRVESINLIFWNHQMVEWKKVRTGRLLGKIGERVIPYYGLDLNNNKKSQVDKAYDLGFWGLKFICSSHSYDDHFYDPIYARAEELGMPCLFHTGVLGTGVDKLRAGTGMSLMRADSLDTIATRFPKLLIQGAHLGNPEIFTPFRVSQYATNVQWDVCGGCRFLLVAAPELLHASMNGMKNAWDQITWASDTASGVFPPEWADGWKSQYEYHLCFWQKILSLLPVPPTTEQLDKFFYGNAKRRTDEVRALRKG